MMISRLSWIVRLTLAIGLTLGGCAAPPATPAGPTATAGPLEPLIAQATATRAAIGTRAALSLTPPASQTPTTAPASETPAALAAAASQAVSPEGPQAVHGIILFIGDGLGESHRLAAQWLAQGANTPLLMDSLPVRGYASTAAADREITDSGAGATALASGVQTRYAAVGVDVDNVPVETILEQAQALGWSVGLVTDVRLADATPGAFAAHVPDRVMISEIARQMMTKEIDVLLGGGEENFARAGEATCTGQPGLRGDTSLIENALRVGYTHICTPAQLAALDLAATDKLLGLFAPGDLPTEGAPSLAELTAAAIAILSRNPNGFFLMVEGGQIDTFAHANDSLGTVQATLALNAAVAQAQVYALGAPNTLIIVAADHETGGLQLNLDGNQTGLHQEGPFTMPDGVPFYMDWQTASHTATPVLVTSGGPYSEWLAGLYPLTHIYDVMRAAMRGE